MRLWTDFNEFDGETVWTSLRRAAFVPEGEPWVGQQVEMWDHEGNVCWGTVVEVDEPIVRVQLDLSTWEDAGDVHIASTFGEPMYHYSQGAEDRTVGDAVA